VALKSGAGGKKLLTSGSNLRELRRYSFFWPGSGAKKPDRIPALQKNFFANFGQKNRGGIWVGAGWL